MSAISGVANAAGTIMQGEIQVRNQTKEQKSELERNELAVIQKESELWKLQTELNGPEVVQYDQGYQEFLVKTRKEADRQDRSPVFQAQVASLLQQQAGHINSEQRMLDRDREQEQFRNEQRLEQAGRQAWRDLEIEIGNALLNNPEMSLDEIENSLVRPFADIPQVAQGWKVYSLQSRVAAAKQQAANLERQASSEFVAEAGIIENSFLTLTSPRLEDAQQFNAAESTAKQAINDMFARNGGYDLTSLSAINDKWAEVQAQFDLIKFPTNAQQTYMNSLNAQYTRAYEQYASKMQAEAYNKAKVSIDSISRFGVFNPKDIKEIVLSSMNAQLGMDIMSYQDGSGYSVKGNYQNLEDLPIAASQLEQKLLADWDKGAEQRNAWLKINTLPVVDTETIKTAKFDPYKATLSEIDSISRKVRKGSDLGVFEAFVKDTLSNPQLPDGSYDLPRIQKTMTILDNLDVSQSILLRGDTVINDPMTAKILRASVWAELNRAKSVGILSDTDQRQILGPSVGPTQTLVDGAYMERFIFGPAEISGSNKENNVEPSNGEILRLHKGIVASNPLMNLLQYADRFYLTDHPEGFKDDEVRKVYHKAVLRASGVSLIDNGKGKIFPVADEYGHAPDAPLDTAIKALDLVPEPGSPLHTSALAQFTNGTATVKDAEETKGMSIRDMFRKYKNVTIRDSDLVATGAASFPSGPAPLPEVARGVETPIKNFSDYEYRDLFGYGVSITNGSEAAAEIRINSSFEKLINDPLFGKQDKNNSKAAKYLSTRTIEDVINENFVDVINQTPGRNQQNKLKAAERMKND
jgi:hypothetical protein